MTCKIDHTDDDGIPRALCRVCNPELGNPIRASADPNLGNLDLEKQVARLDRRKLRELRAEVKVWRNRVTLMKKHKTHPADLKKAEEALRKCEHDLYLVA